MEIIKSKIIEIVNRDVILLENINSPTFDHYKLVTLRKRSKLVNVSKKKETSQDLFRKIVNRLIEVFTFYKWWYTDASKKGNICAYSITTRNSVLKAIRMTENVKVCEAETRAIIEAVKMAAKTTDAIIIASDSMRSVNRILKNRTTDDEILQIRRIIMNNYPRILILWVPAHVGIEGNEFADTAAKNARIFGSYPTEGMTL